MALIDLTRELFEDDEINFEAEITLKKLECKQWKAKVKAVKAELDTLLEQVKPVRARLRIQESMLRECERKIQKLKDAKAKSKMPKVAPKKATYSRLEWAKYKFQNKCPPGWSNKKLPKWFKSGFGGDGYPKWFKGARARCSAHPTKPAGFVELSSLDNVLLSF